MSIDRYLGVDEDGYFHLNQARIEDLATGQELLRGLTIDESGRLLTDFGGSTALVEPFDAPLVARSVRKTQDSDVGEIGLTYQGSAQFRWDSLSLDEWDRFHGVTSKGIPFVLSRAAQMEFFDLLDSFDDESVTIGGKTWATPAWLTSFSDSNRSDFWTNIYQTEKPGWDIGCECPMLPVVLPQLKMSKLRVLVLGCGGGHDAAFFAKLGHVVTGVDFSSAAIERAKARYGEVENLRFVQSDIFSLPEKWKGHFDLVFEHTCYCAITPERRNELVKIWLGLLAPGGHLLGVFFVNEKRTGPPFGGSEWEVRQRLSPHFDFLYWTRWHHSLEGRKSKELVVYARKKS